MISKANCILTALFLMSALSAKETSIRLTDGQTAILRPVLLRSEFVSRGTLRVLRQNSLKIGFDAHGFPKFKSVINRPLHFWETRIAQTPAYSKWLNREFKDYVIQHPEIFHSETIAAYKKAGTGLSLKNPMLKDGTPLQWHHGYDGYELVASDEHGNIHHFGGNKVWGYKDKVDNIRLNRLIKTRIDDLAKIKKNDNAKLFKYGNAKFHPKTLMDYRKGDFSHNPMLSDGTNTKWIYNKKDGSFKLVTVDGKDVFHNFHKIKIYDNHIAINTARRWGNICALDLLFSQIGLAYSGESDWRP